MTNITIKPSPGHVDTKPYGFYIFSLDYFKAAQVVSTLDFQNKINCPAYFLYCRSLELIMKSILLATKKYTLRDLANRKIFGHDLLKGLNLLKKEKSGNNIIKLSKQDKKMISDLNKWYKTDEKRFEYYALFTGVEMFRKKMIADGKYPDLPPLKTLEKLFDNFLNPRIIKHIITR